MSNKTNKLLIGLTLISLTSVALAFGPRCGGPDGPGRGFGPGNPGDRLSYELNLNTDQQKQVKAILEEQRNEAKAWREQHKKETDVKLNKVLNAEQIEKFQSLKNNRPEPGRRRF